LLRSLFLLTFPRDNRKPNPLAAHDTNRCLPDYYSFVLEEADEAFKQIERE
jgi:hypothetical protein